MRWPPRTVVVPIDFSTEAFAALELAGRLVSTAAEICVVHVLPELSPLEPGEVWHTLEPEQRKQQAAAALRQRLSDPCYRELQVEVEIGDPGSRIAACAERRGADLIVMPSHGRSGLRRLLIGSVAERVTRLAHCPVLILRS